MRSRFNSMRLSLKLGLKMLIQGLAISICSSVYADEWTQAQYDQKIQSYVAVVNQTKQILDDPNARASAKSQQQALCLRIQSYKEIVKLSQDHLGLESAKMMLRVAQTFLDRQTQSFNAAGMNESLFCSNPQFKNG